MTAVVAKYCIDTSALIDAWRDYPPANFQGLWQRIDEAAESGLIVAPEEVLHELKKRDDDVYKWAKGHLEMFAPLDEDLQAAATVVINDFKGRLKISSLDADPFVVALSRKGKHQTVTNEKSTGPNGGKIPDICKHYGLTHRRFVDVIVQEGWTF